MSNPGKRALRLVSAAVTSSLLLAGAACSDVASRTLTAKPSHSDDCIICDDGSEAPPALQSQGWRIVGSGPQDPSPVLPDPNATGPMTDAERATFGDPDATVELSILADAFLSGSLGQAAIGAAASGRAIVSAS